MIRLQQDIRLLIADCIHLKSLLRKRWVKPMAEEQQRLVFVRRKLTERFVLLAASRGRLHIRDAEESARIAARLGAEYASLEAAQ